MDEFGVALVLILMLIVPSCTGYGLGGNTEDKDWRKDCDIMGLHMANDGRVYECKEKK